MDRKQVLLSNLGRTVRNLRKDLGLTRKQLGQRTSISERFLAEIEAGRANPSLLRILELAVGLGTTADALLRAVPVTPSAQKAKMLALLGLRGSGKSSVGPLVAARLRRSFVELDTRIEDAVGLNLAGIFELHGEAFFRRTEREILRELAAVEDAMVLAAGGGLVTERETFDWLRAHAHTVWLRAAPEDHWSRVVAQGDVRPMADNEQAFSHLCAILAEREKLYQQAEVTVNTSGRSVTEIADEIALRFQFLAVA